MPLLGSAAVAMWWTVAASDRTEFQEWHSKEHLPERMGIDGFQRGSRWEAEDGSGNHFVLYELDDYATLTSDGYRARLNDPTPWSRKMMPLHHGMVRSQCRIVSSFGAGVATFMMTITLSPHPGGGETLRQELNAVLADLVAKPGITGAHLLVTDTPEAMATIEQQIRGRDAAADWVLLVSGHARDALTDALGAELADDRLAAAGALAGSRSAVFRLLHAMTPRDL